ncbi:metabotropic glutamate receptor 5 [Biomphalaria glabrata]|nr:metabotropic glutamate receptor 5-like [Biomphalaria glabrata]
MSFKIIRLRTFRLDLRAALLVLYVARAAEGYIIGNRAMDISYEDLGDLNVGGLFAITSYDGDSICGEDFADDIYSTLHMMELLKDTVMKVNLDRDLLQDVKFGFVFLDMCSNVHAAMTQVKRFLPRSNPFDYTPTGESNYLTSYKVIGVIGTPFKRATLPIAILLGGAGIPILNFWDWGNDFNYKQTQPTFMRMTSPSWDLFEAMLNLMLKEKWSLFSIVLQTTEEDIITRLRSRSSSKGICLHEVYQVTDSSDFDNVVGGLKKGMSRIVMAFLSSKYASLLMTALIERRLGRQFIWLLTDAWLGMDIFEGSLVFTSSVLSVDSFSINTQSLLQNPWFRKLINKSNCIAEDEHCIYPLVSSTSRITTSNWGSIRDTMMTYAQGLHNFLAHYCPGAKGRNATSCFEAYYIFFIDYLQNVNFKGTVGDVFFKKTGERLDLIHIYQNVSNQEALSQELNYHIRLIATYNVTNGTLDSFESLQLRWIAFPINETNLKTICQPFCSAKAYSKVYLCCWSCMPCKDNEIISQNNNSCTKCPPFQWPTLYGNKYSICTMIEPIFLNYRQPTAMATLVAVVVSLILALVVLYVVCRGTQQDERDTPLWLNVLQLLSTIWGLMDVPIFLVRRNNFTCLAAFNIFLASFFVQYTAMFIRTIHLYYMSNEAKQTVPLSQQRFALVHRLNATLFFIAIIFILAAVITVISTLYPVTVAKDHLELTKKEVDLVCFFPVPQIWAFLLYTIMNLMACSIFCLKIYTQWTGYRQSRFLFTFVVVALIGWIIFMPAYFITIDPAIKEQVLILTLLVNHNCSLILCYTPKFVMFLFIKKEVRGTLNSSSDTRVLSKQ